MGVVSDGEEHPKRLVEVFCTCYWDDDDDKPPLDDVELTCSACGGYRSE